MNASLFAAESGPHVAIKADTITTIFGVPINSSMILGGIAYLALLALLLFVARGVAKGSTNKLVLLVQWAYEGLLSSTNEIVGNKKVARSLAPLAITMFFAVVFCNWFGILPGVGSVLWNGVPLFRGMAADLNFTFALAIITMVGVQIYAIKQFGLFGNAKRYLKNPFKDIIGAFEGLLEFIGEFSRFVALSMRLFGNVFGGEVLLGVMSFLTGWLAWLPLPLLMGFELFIGALQAYVFYMLTVIFTSLALQHGHGEHSEHATPSDKTDTMVSSKLSKESN